MRIIAGKWRGRTIAAPAGQATRPTSDRTREALFSMLASRLGSFEGLRVADLFAGSGALGLEALSRGAAYCTFVERDRAALETIHRNIRELGAATETAVLAQSAEHARPPQGGCDLLFMDPPYRSGLAQSALDRAADWTVPGGWVSLEVENERLQVPGGLRAETERRVGRATLNLFRRPFEQGD